MIWGRHPNKGERASRLVLCWGVSIRSSWRGASAKPTRKNAIEATKTLPSFPSLFPLFLFCSTPMSKKPLSHDIILMAVGCGCGLMAAPDRSQTPLVFFADRPWWRHVGRQTHGYWLWLRSNGCARPQSDRRFSWVLSLGTKNKILGGAKKNRLWLRDLAVAAGRGRSLRFLVNCAVVSKPQFPALVHRQLFSRIKERETKIIPTRSAISGTRIFF